MPKVSIVVPMYRVEKYIDRCLDSLINQTFRDIEIICVDDGSPDKSGEIAEAYAQRDSRVSVIHKENAGLGYARNTGIENARGEFVSFVDSDDYITSDLIADLVETAEKNSADTVIAGFSRKKGDKIIPLPTPVAGRVFKDEEVFSEVLSKMTGPLGDGSDSINMATCGVLYSLEIIRRYGLRYPSEREFISEDMIFNIKYYNYSKIVCGIGNNGYIYCMNPGSLTERYNPERYEKGKVLYEEKIRLFKQNDRFNEDIRFRIEESFLRYSRYAIKSEVKFAKQNGIKKARQNLLAIISDKTLNNMVKTHINPLSAKVDKIIDYCIKKRKPLTMLFILKAGYMFKK